MDISLRPLTRSDIPGWADLLARIEMADRTGEHYGAADLEEEMANPEVVVGKDFVGAFDGPGMVGYYSVLPRGEAGGSSWSRSRGRCCRRDAARASARCWWTGWWSVPPARARRYVLICRRSSPAPD